MRGRGHSRQNYFCDTVQCFNEEKWTACFTLHPHLYFQVEKQTYDAEMNSSHTDQLSAAMRGSRNFRHGGGGGGGGGVHVNLTKKTLTALFFFVLFFFVFFCFFLSPRLILQMSNG